MSSFSILKEKFARLIFPPKCIFCEMVIMPEELHEPEIYICPKCFNKIEFFECERYLVNRMNHSNAFDEIVTLFKYTGMIKESILRFKYFDKPSYYRTFAKLLANRINKLTDASKFDMIISVPLHKRKEYLRGFNQSKLISKALSRELGIPEKSSLMVRLKDTESQSLLNREKRLSNIKGAFKVVEPCSVNGKRILLIDDVLTTGSTINECAKALKDAGAESVTAAVLATGRNFGRRAEHAGR